MIINKAFSIKHILKKSLNSFELSYSPTTQRKIIIKNCFLLLFCLLEDVIGLFTVAFLVVLFQIIKHKFGGNQIENFRTSNQYF